MVMPVNLFLETVVGRHHPQVNLQVVLGSTVCCVIDLYSFKVSYKIKYLRDIQRVERILRCLMLWDGAPDGDSVK